MTGTATGAPVLLSVNVGLPKNVAWQGKTVYTGVWKHPVDGPAMVRRLNIDGDGQGDLAGHGGEQRAVLVYQAGSYRHWQQHLGRDDLGHGSFGENLTVDGLADDEVLHRRPVPHRRGRVRGHPAPGHLLPRRPAPGRTGTARAAGVPPPSRLLHASPARGAHPGR